MLEFHFSEMAIISLGDRSRFDRDNSLTIIDILRSVEPDLSFKLYAFAIRERDFDRSVSYIDNIKRLGFSIDTKERREEFPLLYAIRIENIKVAQYLIDQGADPFDDMVWRALGDSRDEITENQLLGILKNQTFGAFIIALRHFDLRVTHIKQEGKPLLHLVASMNDWRYVQAVLRSGASLQEKDNEGYTALFYTTTKTMADQFESLGLYDIGEPPEEKTSARTQRSNAIPEHIRTEEPQNIRRQERAHTFGIPRRRVPIFSRHIDPITQDIDPFPQRGQPPTMQTPAPQTRETERHPDNNTQAEQSSRESPEERDAIARHTTHARMYNEGQRPQPQARRGVPPKRARRGTNVDDVFGTGTSNRY